MRADIARGLGLVLALLAVSGAAWADAVVTKLEGLATATGAGAPPRQLRLGDVVRGGEEVSTLGIKSTLSLQLDDGTVTTLRGNSRMRLKATGTVGGSGCEDPLLDASRFTVSALEITDAKTRLVWFRCPAMWVGKSGTCDSSMVLPSETWNSATRVPEWAPGAPTAWRLASAEELDTIAAKGCGYLLNGKAIEVMFDTLWTRNESADGRVLRYGVDRKRIDTAKEPPKGEVFAQAIYVRDRP